MTCNDSGGRNGFRPSTMYGRDSTKNASPRSVLVLAGCRHFEAKIKDTMRAAGHASTDTITSRRRLELGFPNTNHCITHAQRFLASTTTICAGMIERHDPVRIASWRDQDDSYHVGLEDETHSKKHPVVKKQQSSHWFGFEETIEEYMDHI